MSIRVWYILKDSTKLFSFDVDAHGNREVTWVNECVMWVMLTSDVSNDAVREAKKSTLHVAAWLLFLQQKKRQSHLARHNEC